MCRSKGKYPEHKTRTKKETTKMKIKGLELVKMWNEANAVISKISRLGEIDGIIRNAGYDVLVNGFSVCKFLQKGTWIGFTADNCDTAPKWRLSKAVSLEGNPLYIERISPEAEYDVGERLSVAEKFLRGDYNGYKFVVRDTEKDIASFECFEKANEYARKVCQSRIDSRWEDRSTSRYYMTTVVNNPQKAIERDEIRHYPWYSYNGHNYYISVIPEAED